MHYGTKEIFSFNLTNAFVIGWQGPGWISGQSTLLQVLISIQSLILVSCLHFLASHFVLNNLGLSFLLYGILAFFYSTEL